MNERFFTIYKRYKDNIIKIKEKIINDTTKATINNNTESRSAIKI